MAAIRGTNTRPELLLRRSLFAAGYRFRLHDANLPGKPDIVLRKFRAVIFVHGCFFHGHECASFRWPASRADFWRAKISGNRTRDDVTTARLVTAGWRVMTVWECALRGTYKLPPAQVIAKLSRWLNQGRDNAEIRGRG